MKSELESPKRPLCTLRPGDVFELEDRKGAAFMVLGDAINQMPLPTASPYIHVEIKRPVDSEDESIAVVVANLDHGWFQVFDGAEKVIFHPNARVVSK